MTVTVSIRPSPNHADEVSEGHWEPTSAISLGIHNIYNGIEDIMLSLAKDIDGLVPSGSTTHQDILDQMVSEISGTRPAVIDIDLYESLTEFKGFQHLVRHRYGFDLRADKVPDNLDRIRQALPAFLEAVVSLERTVVEENTDHIDGGDGAGDGISEGP